MFKSIIASTLAAVTTVVAASPVQAASNMRHHQYLRDVLHSAGIAVFVNHRDCWTDSAMGWYQPNIGTIVVCQEYMVHEGREVAWTEEDLNTLRHEAQHVIQDCMIGSNNDGSLHPVYKQPVSLGNDVLGTRGVAQVHAMYPDLAYADRDWETC